MMKGANQGKVAADLRRDIEEVLGVVVRDTDVVDCMRNDQLMAMLEHFHKIR